MSVSDPVKERLFFLNQQLIKMEQDTQDAPSKRKWKEGKLDPRDPRAKRLASPQMPERPKKVTPNEFLFRKSENSDIKRTERKFEPAEFTIKPATKTTIHPFAEDVKVEANDEELEGIISDFTVTKKSRFYRETFPIPASMTTSDDKSTPSNGVVNPFSVADQLADLMRPKMTHPSELSIKPDELAMEISDYETEPFAQHLIVNVQGYYCKVCDMFFCEDEEPKKRHSSSREHYDQVVRRVRPPVTPKMEPDVKPEPGMDQFKPQPFHRTAYQETTPREWSPEGQRFHEPKYERAPDHLPPPPRPPVATAPPMRPQPMPPLNFTPPPAPRTHPGFLLATFENVNTLPYDQLKENLYKRGLDMMGEKEFLSRKLNCLLQLESRNPNALGYFLVRIFEEDVPGRKFEWLKREGLENILLEIPGVIAVIDIKRRTEANRVNWLVSMLTTFCPDHGMTLPEPLVRPYQSIPMRVVLGRSLLNLKPREPKSPDCNYVLI